MDPFHIDEDAKITQLFSEVTCAEEPKKINHMYPLSNYVYAKMALVGAVAEKNFQ